MNKKKIKINGMSLNTYELNTVIVGSGAAGLNAADRLYTYGQKDIAIITEGMSMGTSRNTGSDKQTYYKLTLAGKNQDSIYDMAETLYKGGSMDGDIALAEAALSPQCFYHLVDIGVPFPHNRFGEYVGYKTDHDPRQRATSVGPLTSKFMTEKLQEQIEIKGIKVFDGYQVIKILTDEKKESAIGLVALNNNRLVDESERYVIFNCSNIIFAVGGPAGMYATSVYPESQTGSSGVAFEAGVNGKNLTESQYGIASVKFRWNLSGTFQQVIPRYISIDLKGNEREFLLDYFDTPSQMLNAIFLKGYQWPFDPRKVNDYGSSLIDIAVYNETIVHGRKVFLDFTQNPERATKNGKFDFRLLDNESYGYLKNSNALFGTPIERLLYMNKQAVDLYKDNGIDLTKEYLEIAVCAQHNNGGLQGNHWWESNLSHFFPVGEVNGSHGIYRPGGTALNSGQVGSTRAAQFIANNYKGESINSKDFIGIVKDQINEIIQIGNKFIENISDESNVKKIRNKLGVLMSTCGAIIRSSTEVVAAKERIYDLLVGLMNNMKLNSIHELSYAFQNRDLAIAAYVYLNAIEDYISNGGKSRGSYLIVNDPANFFEFELNQYNLEDKIQTVTYDSRTNKCLFNWRNVKTIPELDDWFENIWKEFNNGEIYIS